MNEFEIISKDGEDIELMASIPPAYHESRLAGAEAFMARCSFGNMLFWHHKGEGFDIWKSVYDIKRDARVTGRINRPVLELAAMYKNSFEIDWTAITKGRQDAGKIEMYYAPATENEVNFKGGMRFTTVDIHFEGSMLEPYAGDFPLLDAFMNKVHKDRPAKLFNAAQFLCPRMESVIREMIQYQFTDSLASRYFDSYVNILLVILLERISGFTPGMQKYSPADIERAVEARRILTAERVNDKDEAYTIDRLCRRLGTNPYKLKTSFKHCFGTSIGKYKKRVFMEYAEHLLLTGVHSLDEVAMMLGYATPQSFSTAFKTHFNYAPGYIRKKKF